MHDIIIFNDTMILTKINAITLHSTHRKIDYKISLEIGN